MGTVGGVDSALCVLEAVVPPYFFFFFLIHRSDKGWDLLQSDYWTASVLQIGKWTYHSLYSECITVLDISYFVFISATLEVVKFHFNVENDEHHCFTRALWTKVQSFFKYQRTVLFVCSVCLNKVLFLKYFRPVHAENILPVETFPWTSNCGAKTQRLIQMFKILTK